MYSDGKSKRELCAWGNKYSDGSVKGPPDRLCVVTNPLIEDPHTDVCTLTFFCRLGGVPQTI